MSTLSDLAQRLPRWFWPAVAALGGLVLGLLIGWVWWPVQWTNATLTELSPSAKAVYVSAVADAYVADGSATALETVQTRLAPLGNQADEAIVDAIAWYQAQPNADIVRVNNLALLAGEQGAPVDAASLAAGAAPPVGPALAPPPVTEADGAVTAEVAAVASEEPAASRGLWQVILGLIAAIALFGGGIYLFRRVTQETEPESRFAPVAVPAAAPQPKANGSPSSIPVTPTTAWSTTVVRPAAGATIAPGDDLAFDSEELDDDFEDDDFDEEDEFDEENEVGQPVAFADARLSMGPSTAVETEEELRSANLTPRYSSPQPKPSVTSTTASRTAAVPLAVAPAAVPEKAAPAPQSAQGTKPAQSTFSRLATALTLRTVTTAPPPTHSKATSPAPTKAPAPVAPVAPAPSKSTKPATGRRLLASHTCQYVAGVPGYIEAMNISDPRSGAYIGEFGMGISLRNAALHVDPSQVIALEVWLTDNQDPAAYNNQARVLLSDYAAGKDYAQPMLKDREGSVRTMMSRPGGRFTLEGQNLVLEAEIQDVQSDEKGIFKAVRVATSVYMK